MTWRTTRRIIAGVFATRPSGRRIVIDGTGPRWDVIQFFTGNPIETAPGTLGPEDDEGSVGLYMEAPHVAGTDPTYMRLDSGGFSGGTAEMVTPGELTLSSGSRMALGSTEADTVIGAGAGSRVLLETGWTPFTPVWSSSGATQPSLGSNATVLAAYLDLGAVVFFRMQITFGSTTNFGTGAYGFTLGDAPTPLSGQAAAALFIDDSATVRISGSAWITAGSGIFRIGTGPAGAAGMSSTLPFTWAAGDSLIVSGAYEPA